MFFRFKELVLFLILVTLLILVTVHSQGLKEFNSCNADHEQIISEVSRIPGESNSQPKPNSFFYKWNACVKQKLDGITNHSKFWDSVEINTVKCENELGLDQLGLVELNNRDERKYGILPLETDNSRSDNFLTLGIGQDIDAEKIFRDKMLAIGRNVSFYGVDPITEVNAELYQTIGKYFPFAVAGEAGFMSAMVLVGDSYIFQNLAHIDLVYFLDKLLKIRLFDHIWMDSEYAEYGLFDIFYKNGRFERRNLRFCQMSLEVHIPSEEQQKAFMKFIKTLLEEKRYGFFHNKNVGHYRMYLFNFNDVYCLKKYIQPSLYN